MIDWWRRKKRHRVKRIDGDIGLGGYYTRSILRGKSEPAAVLPYGYFDYGRAFVRIDTFGIKTVPMGYGHLELVGRVTLDGFKADTASLQGLTDRKDSIPLGIGTFQETPIGGFFVNAFHDVGKSRGNLFEAIYVGELKSSRFVFYPQVGAEYLSGQYVGYDCGVSATESTASRYAAYQPGGAFNPFQPFPRRPRRYHADEGLPSQFLSASPMAGRRHQRQPDRRPPGHGHCVYFPELSLQITAQNCSVSGLFETRRGLC